MQALFDILHKQMFFSIPEAYKDQYKVAIRCEGAQLILEVK